jgi:hypothetical protein
MKRRAFLATTGLVATTGCLGRAVGGGDGPTTRDDTTARDDVTTAKDEASCPTVHDSVDATVCAGAPNDRAVSFGQSTDRLTAGEVLELTLVNEDAESVGLNPYDWAVYRETDDGWKRVERGPVIEPWVVLEAGDRVHWRVGVGDAAPDTSPEDVYGGSLALDSSQRYAFSVSVDVAGDRVSLVAPFTVE